MAINVARINAGPQVSEAAESTPRKNAGAKRGAALGRLLPFLSDRVTLEDLAIFTRQLALLLRTGNGLVPSIEALSRQGRSPAMRRVLDQVHSGLQDGNPLSDSLERSPEAFEPMYVNIVRAGEATGALQQCLEELTKMLDIQRAMRARIKEAMVYPIVLLCLMGGVMVFMMAFVLPRFAKLFEGIEEELPVTTRFLLGAGQLFSSRLWVLIPIILFLALLTRWVLSSGASRRAWDRMRFKIPVVRELIEQGYMLRMFSSMSLLLANHVPLLEAINIIKHILKSSRYRAFFANLSSQVEAGQGVTPAFQEARFFPDIVKLMVATGESSGALDKVAENLADKYREDLERGVKRLSALLEPIMLVIMGALVGLIALSFIVPIFKMSKAIN
jgi:type II secretory pathway component PulF